jgi:hypothetical protein
LHFQEKQRAHVTKNFRGRPEHSNGRTSAKLLFRHSWNISRFRDVLAVVFKNVPSEETVVFCGKSTVACTARQITVVKIVNLMSELLDPAKKRTITTMAPG